MVRRWSVMGGSLNLQNFVWDKSRHHRGGAQSLHHRVANFVKIPVERTTVLSAAIGIWRTAVRRPRPPQHQPPKRRHHPANKDPEKPDALRFELARPARTGFQNGRTTCTLEGNTVSAASMPIWASASKFGNRNRQRAGERQNPASTSPTGTQSKHPARHRSRALQVRRTPPPPRRARRFAPPSPPQLNGTSNYGTAEGTVNIGQGASMDTAPMSGKLNLNVADLEVFRNFLARRTNRQKVV